MNPLAWLQTSALALGIGLAGGVAIKAVWDYHAPFGWGLGQQLDVATAERDDYKRQLEAAVAGWHKTADEWSGAYSRLESARAGDAAKAARSLEACQAAATTQCRAAFETGVAAGRVLGARDACKPSNSGPAPASGVPKPGDDFREWWGRSAGSNG